MNTTDCKPCEVCPVWKELSVNPIYRKPVLTRTIGGRKDLEFVFLPESDEVEVRLPHRAKPVSNYPKSFNETQFKVMCCRFSYVTRSGPYPPSQYKRNTLFNDPKWKVPAGIFENPRIDPPYLVAVVRKVLENSSTLNHSGYCANQVNCK